MGRVLQRVAVVAATALVGSALALSGTTASADHATCPATHDMREGVSGTLTSTNKVDYWLSNSADIPRTFTLTLGGGEAVLRILDSSCFLILCQNTAPGSTTRTCTTSVPGPVQVEVEWVSGIAPYTLTTNATPATSAVPVVNTTSFPSDDCNDGVEVFTGSFGTSVTPAFTKVRVKDAGSETWVCFRADSDTPARFGGKLVVTDAAAPGTPSTDSNASSCAVASGDGNALPVVLGNPGDPYYTNGYADAHLDSGAAWLCVSDGTNNVRVIVPTGSAPTATLYLDRAGRHFDPAAPGAPASDTCRTELGGVLIADVTTAGSRAYLYVVRNSAGTKVCVRAAGYGGVLHVNEGLAGTAPVVSTGATCTHTLFSHGSYTLSGGISTTSADLCLSVASQTFSVSVDQTTNLNRVSWTPDPGTPDFL